ncbi:MAG: hypothetical protein AABW81_03955 [Nanoarchaeota archaeon]
MIKRMNKRGQSEVGLGTFLLLILGLVALVIIILGFTKGWSFFTDLFGTTDINKDVIAQKCTTLLSLGTSGYCSDKIEVGTDKYVNCEYAKKELGVIIEDAPTTACPGESKKAICNTIRFEDEDRYAQKSNKIKVNDEFCSELLPPTPAPATG